MMNKKTTILYILIGSAIVQFLLILFKDFTNYVPIENIVHFSIMWISSSLITAAFIFLLWTINFKIINTFEKLVPWQSHTGLRLFLEICTSVTVGIIAGCLLTFVSELIFGYSQPLSQVFFYNAIISAVSNVVLVAICESVLQYQNHQLSLIQAEKLKRENIDMRFETLKQQLDPHFLFNSLNILSQLIQKNPLKAQEFIDEFSMVYRYALEVIDKPVVTVEAEMNFVNSYVFLQKIRFGDHINMDIRIDNETLQLYIPPLSVQILLENAFKHNIINEQLPLNIKIFNTNNRLSIINSVQPKKQNIFSKKMGLENLRNRYHLISDQQILVQKSKKLFKVEIPLLKPE